MDVFTGEVDAFSFEQAPPNCQELVHQLVARVVVQEHSVGAELDGIASSHDIDKASSAIKPAVIGIVLEIIDY